MGPNRCLLTPPIIEKKSHQISTFCKGGTPWILLKKHSKFEFIKVSWASFIKRLSDLVSKFFFDSVSSAFAKEIMRV